MTPDEALAELLELVVEEDSGLWELAWRLQTFGLEPPESRRVAEAALRELLARGWVEVYRRPEARGGPGAPGPSGPDAALAQEASWQEPEGPGAAEVRVRATASGRRAFETE